jgi:K+-sensing histidine kinase KdpD
MNLTDNSIYWLNNENNNSKKIHVFLDGNKFEVMFSDSGPGIREDDIPFIFNEFYTAKGIKGRGLGLYITKQLLNRYDFTIEYVNKNKKLHGANFKLNFQAVDVGDNND